MQRALIQYRNPKNYDLVLEALKLAGREDLIGYEKRCLIRPKEGRGYAGGGFSSGQSKVKKSGGQSGSSKKAEKPQQGKNAGTKNSSANKKADAPKKKKTIRNVHKKK